ncbi:MAG TPA: DNA-directed RNA polymerase subunit beta' [Candidatus Paceibacterota bacterium]
MTIKNPLTIKNKEHSIDEFNSVVLKLASPDRIREWSYGEVTKPETMNYRTQRSEKNGLFDEKIFGPEKDYECYCSKYKGIRYKGIVCEKCGVELTRSIVRRERMGHIELSVPVAHIWYLRTLPSRIATVLGMSAADVEKVVYFAGYLVTAVNKDEKEKLLKELDGEYKNKVKSLSDEKSREALTELLMGAKREIESIEIGKVLDEVEYHKFSLKYGVCFTAGIGAEAVFNIFKQLDMKKLLVQLEEGLQKVSAAEREKLMRRVSLVKSMSRSAIRPEWMFINALPVIPAALRPMVALEGGRHATSDVNDLYRRVINRNNRLKKLKEINAPDVILRNEKRILQEAVDALIDNSIRNGSTVYAGLNAAQRRPLKSLADNLKGKRGLFRQNLLGKRVDYSGRSVIVVGPDLKLNQCGLPKHMALELFRPFVISELLKREMAFNIRGASRLIDDGIPEVWAILEQVIKNKRVLLNRAPTLHRLSIQAFMPVLIEGNAIQVHPLVCSPFNADFDGDTMAVHVPLSEEAQKEAEMIMESSKNILKPGSGDPTVTNKMLDIVLGSYWMTKNVAGELGEGKVFASPEEAVAAQSYGIVSYRAQIKVRPVTEGPQAAKYAEFEGKVFDTTVGRILFNELLPADYPFVNKEITKSVMNGIMDDIITHRGIENVPALIDSVKTFGFKYATQSGVTWSIDDVKVPEGKAAVIDVAQEKSAEVIGQYNEGLLSEDEKTRKNVEIWQDAKAQVEKLVEQTMDKRSPVYDMVNSGARGSLGNLTQMVGMKGLISNAQGETIELPIVSSFKEGLTPIEYFVTTHGARKGMTDTALNTARAGYLTRRLFVVAQSVMITEEDCGTKEGVAIHRVGASGIATSLVKSVTGRVLSKDVTNATGEVLFKRGHLVSKDDAGILEKAGINEVSVRSPLACKTEQGVCTQCYGYDLGRNKLVEVGEAVGTVAAQAIGEPGTQLTMRTFHAGGVAVVGGDITAGLPRVEEIFDNRTPKNPAIIATHDGVITEVKEVNKERIIKLLPDVPTKSKKGSEVEYTFHYARVPVVKIGQHVSKGDFLTDGSADLEELFELGGREKAQEYIIAEAKKIYELQGENVSRKHLEVVVREMFGRVRVKETGDTQFAAGDYVEKFEFDAINRATVASGGIEAKAVPVIMGIAEASLNRRSFLSAASFQHTNRMLISASLKANKDPLYGIMENVIIGRLIPAGTGFKGSAKNQMIEDFRSQIIETEGENEVQA